MIKTDRYANALLKSLHYKFQKENLKKPALFYYISIGLHKDSEQEPKTPTSFCKILGKTVYPLGKNNKRLRHLKIYI